MFQYNIEFYNLDVANSQFVFLGDCITYSNLYYDTVLNGIGTCTFDLSVYDEFAKPKYLKRKGNVIFVKRDGQPVWFGTIGNENGSIEDITGTIQVQAYEYLYYFKNRYTPKSVIYSQVEQCTIAWDLINDSQALTNGTLLIAQGNSPTSMLRDRNYSYATISDALTNLTNVIAGFDFSFDPVMDANSRLSSVLFNCYYPRKGSKRVDLGTLSLGVNVQVCDWVTISDLTNSVILEGAGTGTPISYLAEDTASEQAYTLAQIYSAQKDVSDYDTLSKNGAALLNANKVEGYRFTLQAMPNSNITVGTIGTGDSVIVDIIIGNALQLLQREGEINKIAVTVDDTGVDSLKFDIDIYG